MVEASAQSRVSPLAALGHRDFRLLYGGLLISTIGSQITRATTAWQLYDLTGSPAALGLQGFFAAIPLIPTALLGGALADAVERRRLMMITTSLALTTVTTLTVLTALGLVQVWHLYAASLLITITSTLERPARQALIPSLVPREHLLNAYTLMTSLAQTGSLVGPMIAGGALAIGGPAVAYAIDLVTFVVVFLALVLLKTRTKAAASGKLNLRSIVEGLRFVRSKPVIMGLLGLDLVAMLFGYYPTLLPVFARDVLHVAEVGFGALTAAPAAGSLAGASLMLWLGRVRRPGWLMLGAVAGYGCALVGLGLSPWFPLSLAFAALLGITDAISMTIRHTAVQLATPDELRGRVSSAFQISVQGGNSLGALNLGFAASALGPTIAIALGGGIVLLVVLFFGLVVRPIREFRT